MVARGLGHRCRPDGRIVEHVADRQFLLDVVEHCCQAGAEFDVIGVVNGRDRQDDGWPVIA